MKYRSLFKRIPSLICAAALFMGVCGCTLSEERSVNKEGHDLMKGIEKRTVSELEPDDRFIRQEADFSVSLFRSIFSRSENRNVLISPLSVLTALSMSANGADGQTKNEMERLLGGEIPLNELNEYIHSYVSGLPSDESASLKSANSIWLKDDKSLTVKEDFLQRNADYYGAQAYREPFSADTVREINSWVKEHTDGLIDKIVDSIDPQAVMFLINALSFDAEWEHIYEEADILPDTFHTDSGSEQDIQMMHSTEWVYLEDEDAVGFVKNYKGGRYSFAALLPEDGIPLADYVSGLTGEKILQICPQMRSPPTTESSLPLIW